MPNVKPWLGRHPRDVASRVADVLPGVARPFEIGRRLLLGFLYAACAFWVCLVFLNVSGVNVNPHAPLEGMIEGTAHRPYVYRTLLPTTVRLMLAATPGKLIASIEKRVARRPWSEPFRAQFRIPPGWLYAGLLTFGLMYLSLLGYTAVLYRLQRFLLPEATGLSRHAAPVLGLLVLPPFFSFGYIYDFPVLLLSSLCFLCLFSGRWFWYLAWFTLACINKETSVLMLLPFFACNYDRLALRAMVPLLAAQVAIFALTRGLIVLAFASNPGVTMYQTFHRHVPHLLSLPSFTGLFAFIVLLFVFAYRWGEKPVAVKRAFCWLLLPIGVLFLAGGIPGEYRVFYETLPAAVLLLAHSAVSAMRPAPAAA